MVEYAKISFDEHQVLNVKRQAVQQKRYADRISLAMALDLLHRYENRQWYWPILDEIDGLEGIRQGSRTKPAEPFRQDGPLYPLWHKHYFTPSHLPKNVGIRWGLDGKGNRDLGRLCETVPFAEIPHALGVGGYSDRASARRLTGDWIVFAKHDGLNYYLGVSTHEEGAEADGKTLMDRLRRNCEAEFPFCFEPSI